MLDEKLHERLMFGVSRHRMKRILEQCYKHYDELPIELCAEIAEVMNDRIRAAETLIDELDLPTRARNVLECLGCNTVADVMALGGRRIMTRWSCGVKTVNDIMTALNKMGFALPK